MIVYLSKDVGSLIRDTRKTKKMIQQQLGSLVGVAQRRISVAVKNPSETELGMVIKICKVLDLKIDILTFKQNQLTFQYGKI